MTTRGAKGGSWAARSAGHRARQRALSHETSEELHAGAEPHHATAFNHELVAPGPPEVVADQPALDAAIDHLRGSGSFAFDTEFIGEQSFFPRVCLMQAATRERVLLIDALAGIDVTPLWRLVADPAVEKVTHACQQDVEPVMRLVGAPPANIFDVQVAAGFCGLRYPMAMGSLLAEFAPIHLPAHSKFSQWDRRPLTPQQLRYAANDVRYLPFLRNQLGARLEACGNAAAAREECAGVALLACAGFDAERQRIKARCIESFAPSQRAALHALIAWRQETARAHDVPPRTILADGLLAEIARLRIVDESGLLEIRGLPWPVREHHGHEIIAAVRGAANEAHSERGSRRHEVEADKECADAIWPAIEACARNHSIDPALVTSKRELASLARRKRTGMTDGRAPRVLAGWRRTLIGHLLGDLANC